MIIEKNVDDVDNKIIRDLEATFTGKIQRLLIIEEYNIEVCNYLILIDKDKFKKVAKPLRGRKISYFLDNEDDMIAPYYLKEVELFVELNTNAME